jgi:hypothetical protein
MMKLEIGVYSLGELGSSPFPNAEITLAGARNRPKEAVGPLDRPPFC